MFNYNMPTDTEQDESAFKTERSKQMTNEKEIKKQVLGQLIDKLQTELDRYGNLPVQADKQRYIKELLHDLRNTYIEIDRGVE